jgi:hypothetical protein
MIRFTAVLLAAASPAAAQVAPLSFEAGKSLEMAAGQWSYSATPTGSESRYAGHLSVRCDRTARAVTISAPAQPAATLAVATSALTRTLPAGGRLAASDPLLDAIAFSRGRFLVSVGGGSPIAVPSWPEAARSIEDCRN